jgi:hypothetical protein
MFVVAFSAVASAVAAPSRVPVSVCGGVLFAVVVVVSVCLLSAVSADMPASEVSVVSSVGSDGAFCERSAAVVVLVDAPVAVEVAVIPVSVFGVGVWSLVSGTAVCVIAATASSVVLAVATPSGVPVSVCGGALFAVAVVVSVGLLSAVPADVPAGVLSVVSSVGSDGAFCECAAAVAALVGASASAWVAAVIPVSVSGVGVSWLVSVFTPAGMLMFILVIMLASWDSAAGQGVALGRGELPVSANAAT